MTDTSDKSATYSDRTKDFGTLYPKWDGPFFPPHIELLQVVLDERAPHRTILNGAADELAEFRLVTSINRPETESGPNEARVWRVAYIYRMPTGGEAAIFIPNESGKLHAAVYTRNRQIADLREIDLLVERFFSSIDH